MSARTDIGGGADPFDLSARIEARYRREIALHRDLLSHIAADRRLSHPDPRWPIEDNPVEGLSLIDPRLRIELRHSYQNGDDFGSFPPGTDPLALRVHVHAFSAEFPTHRAAASRPLDVVSETESDAWTRALLGNHWADHSYELLAKETQSDRPLKVATLQRIYVLLLDARAQPMLAPDNFDFRRMWLRVESARKLTPRSQTLAAHITQHGPYVDTESFRDPRTEADGDWHLSVTGRNPADLTPLAGETARRLHRRIRVRGAVDSRFRPIGMHVERTLVWVYFQWKGDPERYALSLGLPLTGGDLRGPPLDSPAAIVGTVLAGWREDLATGMRSWGHRTRTEDGARHLQGPRVGE